MYAPQQEIIPPVFTPLPVRHSPPYPFGSMREDSIRELAVQPQEIPEHMAVIRYVIVDSHDNCIREIAQCRHKLSVRPYIARIVPDFENWISP